MVAVAAYDFTVMAGSMGTTGELKVTRLRELALTKRMPFVWLLDSAGARIQEAVGSLFAGSGHLAARRRPRRRHPHRRHHRAGGVAAGHDEAPRLPQLVPAQAALVAAQLNHEPPVSPAGA